jgi:hypothetical protein
MLRVYISNAEYPDRRVQQGCALMANEKEIMSWISTHINQLLVKKKITTHQRKHSQLLEFLTEGK